MKIYRPSLWFLSGFCVLAFLQQGCNIKWEVVNDPYANFHRIGQRVQIQLNQIDSAVQTGNLDRPTAQVLSENDDMVRQLASHYQTNQSADLTSNQTIKLDNMLNDNGMAINDAIQRHDQWSQAFQGRWSYSYNTPQDCMLGASYLQYRIDQQSAAIDDAYQSSRLSDAQARDLRTRVQIVRNTEIGYYNENGRMDLTPGQLIALKQMADDNDHYLRFRTQRKNGNWKGDQYQGWTGQKNYYSQNQWLPKAENTGEGNQGNQSTVHYWDGRPVRQAAPSTNPNPPQAPAPTAIPQTFNRYIPPRTAPAPPAGMPAAAPKTIVALAPTSTPVPVQAVAAVPTATPSRQPGGFGQWNHAGNLTYPGKASAAPSSTSTSSNQGAPVFGASRSSNQTSSNGQAANTAPAKYLSMDPLNARIKQQNQLLLKSHGPIGGTNFRQTAAINQKRNIYQQTLNKFLMQNRQNGVTQDQMGQLSKMLDDIDKAIGALTQPTPVPENGK